MEIHPGETIVAAHVPENRAPYKHLHRIHQVRRCPECVVERGIGFVELMRGDVRTGGRDECVGAALRCECGDKQDEGNREAETAQHGIDYAAQAGPAASTPADQCVIINRPTTWLK